MQPSSLRDGLTSARSSASSNVSCPSRARRITISVTASFGSFPPATPSVFRALRFGLLVLLGLRFGIMAGIVTQTAQRATTRSLQPYWDPGSILLQKGDVNWRRNFDNLPGGRQATRCGIDLENDYIVRELVLRQQVLAARIDGKMPRLLAARGNPPGRDESSVSRIDGKNRNAVVSPVGDVEKLSVRVHGGFGDVVPAGKSGRQRRRHSRFLERPFFRVVCERRGRRAQFAHGKNKFPIRIKRGVPRSRPGFQSGKRGFIRRERAARGIELVDQHFIQAKVRHQNKAVVR